MKFYFAPMEGITKYLYREAFEYYFGGIDKYFTPFIAPDKNTCLNKKELDDILPEHNKGMMTVPQILTNNADDFIRTAKVLKSFGYDEVNLNLGCPSGTVVAKRRGAGFLADPEMLDRFLDRIFSGTDMKISVKTRLGKNSHDEFYNLIEIYNKYPMEELIIHPRIQTDFYKNKPDWKVFGETAAISKNPVCYNGDIFTVKDYEEFTKTFPDIDTVMLGRGLIANPGLVNNIKTGEAVDKQRLKEFHNQVLADYQELLFGERNVLFKMKEFSLYLIYIFSDYELYEKKIKKAATIAEYKYAVNRLFREQEIVEGAGFRPKL